MAMSAAVWDTVTAFAARFAPPVSAAAPFGPTTPPEVVEAHAETCRAWTRRLAEQLAYSHGVVWGHKRAAADRPPSKDAVATQVPFVGYDVLRGSGTGAPELAVYPPLEHDLAGQVFIAVPPTNHLGSAPEPPDPPVTLATVSAQVAALDTLVRHDHGWALDVLLRDVAAIKAHLLP